MRADHDLMRHDRRAGPRIVVEPARAAITLFRFVLFYGLNDVKGNCN